MKVEVAVLGFLSLRVPVVSVDVKQRRTVASVLRSCVKVKVNAELVLKIRGYLFASDIKTCTGICLRDAHMHASAHCIDARSGSQSHV